MSSIVDSSPPSGVAAQALRRLFWRVHFWAGLLTAPLVLWAALTGLLYVFTPQIEARVHASLDRVATTGPAASLDRQWAAALAAQPGWQPRAILPAVESGRTTQVLLAPAPNEHAGHGAHAANEGHGLPQGRIVYLDPASAQVVGSLDEMARFKIWAKKLHASALQGDGWRWPIELAASWMLLMFATGLAMWWPTRGRASAATQTRSRWRRVHTAVGLAASGFLAVVLLTGLTWSRHAGDHFRSAQQALGQASPKPPRELRSAGLADGSMLSMQAVFERAQAELPGRALQLTPPRDAAAGVWRIDTLVPDEPTARHTLMLDGATGRVLWRSGWGELPVLAKATAVGIPFHRAELGMWNQVLLALAALAAIASVVSGLAMAWLRRPRRGLGVPAVSAAQMRAVPAWLWALVAALAFALPVFGISFAVFAALELLAYALRRARPSFAA